MNADQRLPIACTLSPQELQQRRADLLPGLIARAERRDEIDGGYRWRFAHSPHLLQDLASMIEAERQCCRFLRFQLTMEPDEGPVWLEVTGPDGTRKVLASLR